MELHTVWFIIDLVFWVGFFVLEGFDFGVGMLHWVVGRDDTERRMAINTIGPFWDGNEVWLIVAGAVIFAAFPAWYATMFSSLYLVMAAILIALIMRGVSFEFRGKSENPAWRRTFTWTLGLGSLLIPFLIGTGLGDLLHGLPFGKNGVYTGSFWGLLTPYGLYTGTTLTVLAVLAGATFLTLKAASPVRERARAISKSASLVAVVVVLGFVIWTREASDGGVVPTPTAIVALLAVAAAAWVAWEEREGWAFTMTVAGIGFTVTSLFEALYPNVMVSSTNHAYNLTVANASSNDYALRVMTVVAAIFTPAVLAYQAWNFWVFRRRLGAPASGRSPAPSTSGPPGARSTGPQPASEPHAFTPSRTGTDDWRMTSQRTNDERRHDGR